MEKEEMSADGWDLFALAWKDYVLFYRGAILREGLIVVQQGEKLAECYGPPKDANHRSELLLGEKVNDINRRIKEPSI